MKYTTESDNNNDTSGCAVTGNVLTDFGAIIVIEIKKQMKRRFVRSHHYQST